jgi:hypothetical protein
MAKNKKNVKPRDPLPENFESLESFWEFWDTHSTADYEDLMDEVNVTVSVRGSKTYCPIARDLATQIRAEARRQGISTETLVNLWLREKLVGAGERMS